MQRFNDHNLEAIYIPKTPRKAVLPSNLTLQFHLSFEFPIIFNFNFQFSNYILKTYSKQNCFKLLCKKYANSMDQCYTMINE